VDEKIVAICKNDPYYNGYTDISELPNHLFSEIRHFYAVYKELEHKKTVVKEIEGREEALKVIIKSQISYKNMFGKSR
jgi:inorganic pyrophosphatase